MLKHSFMGSRGYLLHSLFVCRTLSSHAFRHQKKRLQNRRQKTTTRLENYSQRHQNESQNGAKNWLRELNFWFLLNLVFVQQYKGFAWFSWFLGTPGRPKNHKKTTQKTKRRKRRPKTNFLEKNTKINLKMKSDLEPEFSPNSFPRRHFSDLGPKGAKRGPKGAKREPKGTKRSPKRRQRAPKRDQK